jgi:hypothetical protein
MADYIILQKRDRVDKMERPTEVKIHRWKAVPEIISISPGLSNKAFWLEHITVQRHTVTIHVALPLAYISNRKNTSVFVIIIFHQANISRQTTSM